MLPCSIDEISVRASRVPSAQPRGEASPPRGRSRVHAFKSSRNKVGGGRGGSARRIGSVLFQGRASCAARVFMKFPSLPRFHLAEHRRGTAAR